MKVLNVNFSIDPLSGGGTAERTYQVSRFLIRNNIDCTVLTLTQNVDKNILNNLKKSDLVMLPCLMRRFYIPLVSLKRLKKIIKNVDIVHLIGHWSFLNVLVYNVARSLKKPYVLCPAGALPIYGRSKILKKIYNWVVGNNIVKNASGYIAITEDEISLLQNQGIDEKKITHIPNGICVDDFYPVKESANSLKKKYNLFSDKYLLFLGRLNYIKGPDLLLDAFSRVSNSLQDYCLVFAGPDDGMLLKLKEKVLELGIEKKVHFIGCVGGQDKTKIYQNASLLIIPSRQEAMSIVVLEAGVLAKPVLMTEQCGFPELEKMHGGEVVPATIDGITRGLKNLLLGEINLPQLGKNMQRYILQNYLWDIQIDKLITFYNHILYKNN